MIGYSESFLRPIRLVRFEPVLGDPIVFLEGIDSGEKAAELVDHALFLEEDLIRYENPFSDPRVIGFSVKSEEGEELGEIDGIIRTPAHYVWSVRNGGREWLLPAIEPFVVSLDDRSRCVTVRLIPGLLGDDEEENGHDE
jgi:16S rRNA processing protein RimM